MHPLPRHLLLPVLLLTSFGMGSFPAPAAAQAPATAEAYRNHALTRQGDPVRGRQLFNDARLICADCHTVDGSSGKAGPDLRAAGDAFGRRDLVNAVLHPSATIAPGYGALFVETTTGESYQGTLKQKSERGLQIMGADGKLVSLDPDKIRSQTGLTTSLMPEGLAANVSVQEFTDLIEYLTTLKMPESALEGNHGMPRDIPELARPVAFELFFETEFKLPRGKAESGLSGMRQIPGSGNQFLVLHQTGVIWRMVKTPDGEEKSIFAELQTEVFSERGPNGLLDVAFHPQFRENRKYYLFYQVFENGVVTTHVVEKQFDASFQNDSGTPPRLILKIASVAEDHSGGCLAFGPDGFLYIVMGDTGPHHDPNGHAQNLQLLLGKMLRLDVNRQDPGLAYAIPPDNPFVGQADARPEIWAYGLRNPWRFCFDRLNGDLWLADVGQDRVEEVNLIRRGENYGWNIYEGYEPFSNQYRREDRTYAKPVFAYHHKYGNSITGGHVFRGDKTSSFHGVYLCADYTSKRIFGITQDNGILKTARQIGKLPQRVVSFCEDEAGTHYAIGYEGKIWRINFTAGRFE